MNHLQSNLSVLSPGEIEQLHQQTVHILGKIGIKVMHPECLAMCRKMGAQVDETTQVVKIPETLLMEVINTLRNEAYTKEDQVQKLQGYVSTQVFLTDYISKTRRFGELDDIKKGIALTEKLSQITLSNAVVVPSDVPKEVSDVEAFRLLFSYATKPGDTYILSSEGGEYIIDMSEVMGVKQRYLLDTVSPLQFRPESLEMALLFAKRGHRLDIASLVMAGATGPVTLAGTLALQNAETLACVFLVYCMSGQNSLYGGYAHSVDMRSFLCSFGSPNQSLIGIAMAQMAKFYGLKPATNCALSDSLMPDFQSGFEKGSTAIYSALAGIQWIGAQGLVGADQGFSFEQLVLDNEWIGNVNYIAKGIRFDEETMAQEVIESVGIGGNFMAEEHTFLNMHEDFWDSAIFNRQAWDPWIAQGGKDSLQKAHDFVNEATAGYQTMPPVIDDMRLKEINRIADLARTNLAK